MWTIVTIVHTLFLSRQFGIELEIAVTDALLYDFTFAIFGLGLWYVVKYSTWDEKDTFQVFINLSASAVIIIGFWISTNELILSFIFKNESEYLGFLKNFRIWRIFIGLFFFTLIVMLYYVILYYARLQEKKLLEIELQKNITEAKLNLIRNQINPHFLFNSLNSISALTLEDGKKAREMIQKLSDFLRFSLSREPKEMIRLSEEIEISIQYLEIEKVRFADKFQFGIELPKHLESILIPNMILQPLLENAIKYGVQESFEMVVITLNVEAQNGQLIVTISNSLEDAHEIKASGTGFGHRHIQERLALIYGEQASCSFHQHQNAFVSVIRIPLDYKF